MPPTPPSGGGDKSADQAANMTRQMAIIMPLMFGLFSLSFASGLSIYFVASNVIGIVQYSGDKLGIKRLLGQKPEAPAEPEKAPSVEKPKRSLETEFKPKRAGVSDSRLEHARSKGKAKG
jgi:membrane protein insertase Oxa1/YidC/SpoIIIJ